MRTVIFYPLMDHVWAEEIVRDLSGRMKDIYLDVLTGEDFGPRNGFDDAEVELLAFTLGTRPQFAVCAGISGRVDGRSEVRQVAHALLSPHGGCAQDDFCQHAWSLAEIDAGTASGHEILRGNRGEAYRAPFRVPEEFAHGVAFLSVEDVAAGARAGWLGGPQEGALASDPPYAMELWEYIAVAWTMTLEPSQCAAHLRRLAQRSGSLDIADVAADPEGYGQAWLTCLRDRFLTEAVDER
ncbi:hypothetical protein [Catelliglobosispora koreensis]|uniref:hypothetical protein n=1 Tax=Catelliglobosispora koreensis TaxID=129052 RepID=UPI000373D731|nr:hypothetical protein [Catelliglobosispora koreensis]